MNKFEDALCYSVEKSFKRYESITDNWLFHAPEHYLQNFILLTMGKSHEVWAEATRKKISDGEGRPRRGRPPAYTAKRYDLIVWKKSSDALRAVIEIKRSWSLNENLRKDTSRIKRATADAGYLIVYSETRVDGRYPDLSEKFERWGNELSLTWLNSTRYILGDDGEWRAGFALLRD